MNDTIRIVQTLDDFDILLKGTTKTIEIETKKKQKRGFLGIILGTLGASLLESMLAGKKNLRAGYGNK